MKRNSLIFITIIFLGIAPLGILNYAHIFLWYTAHHPPKDVDTTKVPIFRTLNGFKTSIVNKYSYGGVSFGVPWNNVLKETRQGILTLRFGEGINTDHVITLATSTAVGQIRSIWLNSGLKGSTELLIRIKNYSNNDLYRELLYSTPDQSHLFDFSEEFIFKSMVLTMKGASMPSSNIYEFFVNDIHGFDFKLQNDNDENHIVIFFDSSDRVYEFWIFRSTQEEVDAIIRSIKI